MVWLLGGNRGLLEVGVYEFKVRRGMFFRVYFLLYECRYSGMESRIKL